MSDAHDQPEAGPSGAHKKTYTPPKLTEYGSVAKLTMSKGSTAVENPGTKKKKCL